MSAARTTWLTLALPITRQVIPAAIAVELILQNKFKTTGVHIPIIPEIYNPILDELETFSIKFFEKSKIL